MTRVLWDQVGERTYETGVDHGVLYLPNVSGVYDNGYGWIGLVTVTESPSGAEANAQYADNIKYLNIQSAEEFGGTIEAFTYPPEFAQCDGSAQFEGGIYIGQQDRKTFGLSYRTIVGNDLVGNAHGYKLHLVYGALAAPSERAYGTVNDSPEPITFSWEFSCTPVPVGTIGGTEYKPTATLVIDSTNVDADALADLEDLLYGTVGTDPSLPTPAEVIALFAGSVTTVTLTVPTFDQETNTITIPTVTGVQYTIDGVVRTGTVVITENKLVKARVTAGYKFAAGVDTDWMYTYEA
jgi:hypothetical protein